MRSKSQSCAREALAFEGGILLQQCTDSSADGQNAYLVKRKQSGGVQLSRDPMNLNNKHARIYEGFVNDKVRLPLFRQPQTCDRRFRSVRVESQIC